MLQQFPQNQSKHFSHYLDPNLVAKVQIIDNLKPTKYQDKYIIKVIAIGKTPTKGTSILIVKKDSLSTKLALGQVLFVPNFFAPIEKPKNPYSFDYAHYMAKKGVYFQNLITQNQIKPVAIKINTLRLMGLRIRDFVQSRMKENLFGNKQWGIVNAMVLGDKQFISKDLKGQYANAGVVHILAVSGLHVGILMLIFTQLFQPIRHLKNGKLLTPLLIIMLLWIFALISGLSGSVVRAVTMFSFITISTYIDDNRASVLHAVFTSYFLLVLVYPLFVFDIGFQLSYLAVIGIVVLQPKLMEIFPKNTHPFLYKNLQLLSVSIAATLATLPLSLYYFHQFPGLFWLSNLVIIPFVGIILSMGIIVAFLGSINLLPDFIVLLYDALLYGLNQFVAWIARQEAFLFQNIHLSLLDVVIAYTSLFLLIKWLYSIKHKRFINWQFRFFLMSVVVLQSVFLIEKFIKNNQSEWVVFHQNKASILGQKDKSSVVFYTENDALKPEKIAYLKSYITQNQPSKVSIHPLKNIFRIDNQIICRIDSLGVYQNFSFKPKIFLFSQSPKINLERLIQTYQPNLIIADGSNAHYLQKKWEKTCNDYRVQFHATKENGAFVLQKQADRPQPKRHNLQQTN